jgi:hypothetical protein
VLVAVCCTIYFKNLAVGAPAVPVVYHQTVCQATKFRCFVLRRYIDYMRLVLGSKAHELYQSLDAVLEPPKPGKAAGQQVRRV